MPDDWVRVTTRADLDAAVERVLAELLTRAVRPALCDVVPAPSAKPPAGPDVSVWLTTQEAAAAAKCGPKMIYREVKRGRLRAARLGGRGGAIRIHRDWITQWLENSATPIAVTVGRAVRR